MIKPLRSPRTPREIIFAKKDSHAKVAENAEMLRNLFRFEKLLDG